MPNEKVIKVQEFSLSPPLGLREKLISMNELREHFDFLMTKALQILEEPDKGALAYEFSSPNDCELDYPNMYRVQKIGPDSFAWWDVAADTIIIKNAQDTLHTLVIGLPYMSFPGLENKMDILAELARREKAAITAEQIEKEELTYQLREILKEIDSDSSLSDPAKLIERIRLIPGLETMINKNK